jgi:hypothetical protein
MILSKIDYIIFFTETMMVGCCPVNKTCEKAIGFTLALSAVMLTLCAVRLSTSYYAVNCTTFPSIVLSIKNQPEVTDQIVIINIMTPDKSQYQCKECKYVVPISTVMKYNLYQKMVHKTVFNMYWDCNSGSLSWGQIIFYDDKYFKASAVLIAGVSITAATTVLLIALYIMSEVSAEEYKTLK